MLRSPLRILFLLALAILGPNLLWVTRSSVLLHNTATEPLTVRLVLENRRRQVVEAGTLAPGASRFLWIAPAGEATLSVELQEGPGWDRRCTVYVEQGMYRVAITLRSAGDVACKTSFPILERLLVVDVLT